VGVQRTERIEEELTEWVCPCNISYGMQMKMICLARLLLGTDHGCITINPNKSVLQCNANIPSNKQFKVTRTPSAGKVMLTMFLDYQEVLSVHFQKRDENVYSSLYVKFC
jgi:hypothetical protein